MRCGVASNSPHATSSDSRGPSFFDVESQQGGTQWLVRQVIDDPAGNRDWAIHATVDLTASDEAGELVIQTLSFARHD